MRVMSALAAGEMGTLSGKEYEFCRMRLYVDLTLVDSNGGLPISRVYRITPILHTSTS